MATLMPILRSCWDDGRAGVGDATAVLDRGPPKHRHVNEEKGWNDPEGPGLAQLFPVGDWAAVLQRKTDSGA